MPNLPGQHHTEMGHWHVMSIYGVVVSHGIAVLRRFVMRYDLMPIQIEINPMLIATSFSAAQHIGVESTGFLHVAYGEGQMKRWNWR